MVNMAPRLTFGSGMAEWQERIDLPRLREYRAGRMRSVMRKHGVSAMLVARHDNTRYITGLRGSEFMPQLWYVLFFAEDDPVIFAAPGWLAQMPDQAPWIKHWRIARNWLGGICGPEASRAEAKLLASEVADELRQRKLQGEKLAVLGFDALTGEALRAEDLNLTEGWPLMLEARSIKSADEINCIKMATAIADAAWGRIWQLLRPGVQDAAVSREAVSAAYEAGAEEIGHPLGLRSGPLAFDRAFERSGRIIQWGDLVYGALCGITYMGYRTCYYRTFIVGRRPNDKEKDWHKRLVDRLDAVISEIKPGATTADAARHFAPASTWGYKEEAEVLTMEIGHGLGMHGYELPVINRQWSLDHPQVFEPGMVIAVEGREGEHRVGGVRIEDVVVVTENGCELIDFFPRDEILVAPL